MSFTRLLLVLAVVGAGYWLLTKSGVVGQPHDVDPASQSPVERARAAARKGAVHNAQSESATRDGDAAASAGAVTENMTPEQVRALLGSPDSVDSGTTETGVAREKWTYRSAGKTVVFENGVVVRVE